MKKRYKWVFWSVMLLSVLTAVTLLIIISDLSLFTNNPQIFILSAGSATVALSVLMHNHYHLPVLKNLRLQGRMIISSLALLILSAPAAVVYIYYDLNGEEGLKLLSSLFVSLSAVFFYATLYTFTMPSRSAVLYFFRDQKGMSPLNVMVISAAAVLALFIVILAVRVITGAEVSGLVLILPLFAILQVILDVILSVDFRNAILRELDSEPMQEPVSDAEAYLKGKDGTNGFRSVLLFQEHYLDLICGQKDYLVNRAGDSYAAEVVRTAGETFDPALLPSLKAIASGMRFSESVRHEANAVISAVEKYYADPVRNSEMLRKPGISEKTAAARAMLISRRKPQASDVMRLISDPDPEVRRAAMAIAGYFDIRELREEAIQALSSSETEKEAYYLLTRFGPDSFRDIIGSALKQHPGERVGLMLMRLLNLMPVTESIPYLTGLITGGSVGVRLAAAKYLCRHRVRATEENRGIIEESLNAAILTISRLTALHREASKNKFFLLSEALQWERSMNLELIYCLLSFLSGPVAACLIRKSAGSDTAEGAGIAAEVIDTAVNTPVRKPVRALLGNHTDAARLNSLSAFYPIREVRGESLATMILSSEQNITAIWTKACALRKIAAAGQGIGKELALSYLFSNTPLLQEEAAGVIRRVNPEWFKDAEGRLPVQVRQKVAAVINNSVPEASLIFDKTRFLSLCFNNIPEERIIMLASDMNYSESYNTGFVTGQLTWIVPSHHGKSGLYSLPVSDISRFIFHYPEYTDIFVNYIDNNRVVTVKG